MGLVGKLIGCLVIVGIAFFLVPKMLEDFDMDAMMSKIPGMPGLSDSEALDGVFAQYGPAPVRATQAHAIVEGGEIVHVEIVMEQTANRTFDMGQAVWLVDGLDAAASPDVVRDTDGSMAAGQTNRSDIWRSTVTSQGWRPGQMVVSLHLAEQAGIQWEATVPAKLEEGRVRLEIVPAA